MADRAARRNGLSRRDDGIGIDAIMPVELGERSGLAEVLDAQGAYAMAGNGAKPCEGRRMAVKHGDNPAMRWHVAKQPLDVRACVDETALRRALGAVQPALSRSAEVIASSPTSRRSSAIRPTAAIASGATAPV